MPLDGEYEPSPWDWVSKQVDEYERSGGQEGGELQGKPVVILTTRGRKTGKLRKSALMRVERDGRYAVVASMGGAPKHPVWYLNLMADPSVTLQDGDQVLTMRARTATPEERRDWWPVATAAWPPYDEYQTKTQREIPVVLFDPA
ncbi:MAG TPA: nitroreductase family deazaflavin-dependent oxidoreductase [Acidimicrobiia bacterium]|nr:nitroreductase family deazaflavin-dependent oxidoreductase [Acidimicrobiia bacterium]